MPPQFVLSRVESNAVFEAALKHGLSPADFKRTIEDYAEKLLHVPTGAFFLISRSDRSWFCQYWPDIDNSRQDSASDWRELFFLISKWLIIVEENHSVPDLWAEAAKVRFAENEDPSVADGPFTNDELQKLAAGLEDIEQFIVTTQQLDSESQRHLRGRFAYLLAAAKRGMSKIDWRNIFVGEMVSLTVAGVLSSGYFQQIMIHAVKVIGPVINGVLRLVN